MTNLGFGVMLFVILGYVQYSWIYETVDGIGYEFKSKWSYISMSVFLGVLVGYFITTGLYQAY
ncbi:hypothetical protein GLW07_20880 [Bacillus hwajinpoensis]|uniref:Uncharacterized protein n=1 Tax=Guptibacillus hwajinpoensis TaxID=208199 RepID=A0A845F438_9BACL|nr:MULTISPECIES: hypothetical protein [Bacillaceae]MYL65822.1 hypothetical protein [Pseudalkalibacillus hwajinpoensis]PFG03063.1 hypothetical protein ATG70_4292 [Bacillus sp. es.036]